jgi:hypothetical protein
LCAGDEERKTDNNIEETKAKEKQNIKRIARKGADVTHTRIRKTL